MNDDLERSIKRYLHEQKDTLWGRSFDISDEDGRTSAAQFLTKVLSEMFDPFTWIELGKGLEWCSDLVCSTHEGVPYTEEEEKEWQEGIDPCAFILRMWP